MLTVLGCPSSSEKANTQAKIPHSGQRVCCVSLLTVSQEVGGQSRVTTEAFGTWTPSISPCYFRY